jgi:hypothetical protein
MNEVEEKKLIENPKFFIFTLIVTAILIIAIRLLMG